MEKKLPFIQLISYIVLITYMCYILEKHDN